MTVLSKVGMGAKKFKRPRDSRGPRSLAVPDSSSSSAASSPANRLRVPGSRVSMDDAVVGGDHAEADAAGSGAPGVAGVERYLSPDPDGGSPSKAGLQRSKSFARAVAMRRRVGDAVSRFKRKIRRGRSNRRRCDAEVATPPSSRYLSSDGESPSSKKNSAGSASPGGGLRGWVSRKKAARRSKLMLNADTWRTRPTFFPKNFSRGGSMVARVDGSYCHHEHSELNCILLFSPS